MRYSNLNSPPVPPLFTSFQEKLSKLRLNDYFSLENIENVPDTLTQYIDPYKDAIDKFIVIQHTVETKKKELADFEKLARGISHKTEHTEKLLEIIDDMCKNAGLEELQKEYEEAAREVARYQALFRVSKSMDISSRYICYICLEHPSDVLLYGCNHILCHTCSNKISSQCPFCRTPIREKLKMYLD